MSVRWLLVAGLIVSTCAGVRADDWPAFRGPDGTGVSAEKAVPVEWSQEKNVRWKSPLPGPGNSSPIVSGDRVFLTCASEDGKSRGLYCFSRDDGRELWSQVVRHEVEDPTHHTNPYCGASPAADGRRVVVWHGSAGVHCYDYEGSLLWSRDLGQFRHIWGYGSSPVFYRPTGAILLNCGPGPRTFVAALNAETGETLWQADEPGGDTGEETPGEKPVWVGSWSTPLVTQVDGHDQVLVSLPHHVKAYDPRTGKVLWLCQGLGDLVYTSPLVGEGIGVAMGGYHGPAMAFRLGGSGDVTETNRLWVHAEQNPQRIGSGVIIDGHIYQANADGTAQCFDLTTGEERWKDRLPGGTGVWGSVLAAEGRLYVTNQQGATIVFAPNPARLEVLGINELGEASNSTPAFSEGQVFLRTMEHLYCVEDSGETRGERGAEE